MEAVDQKQRDTIINEIDKNIFVEAGAGSGKTRSLVKRMVMMVRKGRKVSEICAITFTKAAAIEFYSRFETELSEAINSNIPENERKLCEEALLDIDLCFMGTIDAFCNMILSENPIEAHIPLSSTIVSDEEYKFLIAEEYNSIINGVQTQVEKDALDDFIRFQYKPKEAFTECVNRLLSKRNYETKVKDRKTIQTREEAFYQKYQDEIRKLMKNIVANDGKYMNESNSTSKKAKEFLKDNYWQIDEDWKEIPSIIMNYLNKGFKDVSIIPSGYSEMYKTFSNYFELSKKKIFYAGIKDKMDELIGEYQSIQADYTLAFVTLCIDKVSKNLINKGKLSFFDNLLLFRDLLKEDAAKGGKLIQQINSHHKYYLVDEFQDTDPLQSEIVFYLTAIQPNEDYTKCKPAPGTLFIVGDPKQSIYRFRNADVVSYDFVKQLFIKNGDVFLELTTNFRSHVLLTNYFNDQFKDLFADSHNGLQAPFTKVDYYSDNKEDVLLEGVYQYTSDNKNDPSQVGNLIINLVKKGYKYRDIMVLTNTRPKLRDYMEEFENRSIPYEIVGQSMFDKCEPFINLRYLFGAIAHPDNSFYSYKVLRKVLKISDSHIYSIFNNKGPNLLNITNDKKIDKIINFYNDNKNKDIIVVFDKLLTDFNLLSISNVRHLEYLYYAKELLREKISDGSIITLQEAYKFLCDLTDKDIVERCLSLSKITKDEKEQNNRVLLANVHKVKGLESKIVILTSNYDKKLSNPEDRVEIHSSFEDKKNYVIKITKSGDKKEFIKIDYVKSLDYKTEKTNEGDALQCERDRIAYVAATRAIDALFISSNSLNKDKENKTPWGTLLKSDLIKQDDTLLVKPEEVQTKEIKTSTLYNDVIKFDSKFFDKTYEIKSPSKLINIIEEKDEVISNTINNDATLKGTIVHRLLELFVSNKFSDSLDNYLSIINNEFILEGKYDVLLKDVYNTMKNGGFNQDSGKIIDLIGELKGSDEIITEVPFAYKDGSDIYNGIIDLLYKKNNKWYIVDYKTNLDGKELDKKYENQLEGYKKALFSQGIEADAYIYYIDIK